MFDATLPYNDCGDRITAAAAAAHAWQERASEREGGRRGPRTRTSNSDGTVFKLQRFGEILIVELLANEIKTSPTAMVTLSSCL